MMAKRKIVSFVFVFLVGCVESQNIANEQRSLEASACDSARSFAVGLDYRVRAVVCMNSDLDGDGYVSCAVRVEERTEPFAIECAFQFSMKSGCRMQNLLR